MLSSFRTRLIVGTTLWVIVALVASDVIFWRLFHHHVMQLFEDELRGHYEEITGLAQIDGHGRPSLRHSLNDPRFVKPEAGFYWEIAGPTGIRARSSSLAADSILGETQPATSDGVLAMAGGPRGPVYRIVGTWHTPPTNEALTVAIAADARIIDDVVGRFHDELLLAFLGLGAGLVAAAWASVTFGLLPLRRVRSALQAVRLGKAARMPDDLPLEVSALAGDLNRLIEANEQTVRRARAEAGRLAHGLKTPLAALLSEARKADGPRDGTSGGTLVEQCERMRRQIEYQLATLRPEEASQLVPGNVTVAAPAAQRVIVALSNLYENRRLSFSLEGASDAIIACDPRDFDELIGNLVDNAGKWARTSVKVSLEKLGSERVIVRVEDDGPGLPAAAREIVFRPGNRLDDSKCGNGLGLAIVRDIVSRYGGRAWMASSPLGGASACLELPAALG